MATLSIVIAVKNEEDKIRACLDHVKWADEIIIVDNCSTDKTVKICREYTKKVFYCAGDKYNYIPHLHNFGIKKATKDWILILDADVIVPEQAKEEINKCIKNKNYNGYYVPHQMVAFGRKMKCALFCNILKLFRRGYGYFDESSAHCTLTVKGKVGKLKSPVLHYAHPDITTYVRKMNLYTSQDAQKISDTGRGGLLNRKIKKAGFYSIIIEPFLYGTYLYTVKRYYKDGIYGLIVSILMMVYLFLERAKVFELKQRGK